MHHLNPHYFWGLLRIAFGWMFLWSFLDKLIGLGFATTADTSWLEGVSPTAGFLENATRGPLAPIYQAMAGSPIVDWLFMIGLLLLGVSLLLGIGVTIAGHAGALLMLLLWSALLPPTNNPIIDDHIIYALALLGLAHGGAGQTFGFGKWWKKTAPVKDRCWLE